MKYRTETDDRGDFIIGTCDDGREFVVDASDRDVLGAHRWFVIKHVPPYVARAITVNGKRRLVMLHREIMNAPSGMHVDHRNFDTLNCRRYELRLATPTQNYTHVRPGSPRSGKVSISGFRGVYLNAHGQWYSCITINCKARYLGLFETAEVAARAWDAAALEARGEFAVLNFPLPPIG